MMGGVQRALVLGAGGQVGRALLAAVPPSIDCTAATSKQVDICDAGQVQRAIRESQATVVINCAALTQVDVAEVEADRAFAVNAVAPGTIARVAREHGARFLHLSTDYVFDGSAGVPYTIDAPVSPVSVYGRSKADGEAAVLSADNTATVVRTAWVHSSHSRNFVRLVYDAMVRGDAIEAVDDQVSSPTSARYLAHVLWRVVAQPVVGGILHVTDSGVATRFDVAMTVRDLVFARERAASGAAVSPVPMSRFPTPARRPLYSVLDKHATWGILGEVAPHWSRGVRQTVEALLDA